MRGAEGTGGGDAGLGLAWKSIWMPKGWIPASERMMTEQMKSKVIRISDRQVARLALKLPSSKFERTAQEVAHLMGGDEGYYEGEGGDEEEEDIM